MKKKLFFAIAFLLSAQQAVLWGMDSTVSPETGLKYDETIFLANYSQNGMNQKYGTGKKYGIDGWQRPGTDSAGHPVIPVASSGQAHFLKIIQEFKPLQAESFKRSVVKYSLDTPWIIDQIGREDFYFYYPLQYILETSWCRNDYKSKIFEILIDAGAPIQNIKGYCPFRHLLNLILKRNNRDLLKQYKACVDVLIKKGFDFDVPLAKNNGHDGQLGNNPNDVINADAHATGRTCITKAIEYSRQNTINDYRSDVLEGIKDSIDAISVASPITKNPHLAEKKTVERVEAAPTTPPLMASLDPAASTKISVDALGALPYVVATPLSSKSGSSNPPLESHAVKASSFPLVPSVATHTLEPKPEPRPAPAATAQDPSVPLGSDVSSAKPASSSAKSRLLEWCKTTGSTTIKENVCVLVVGAIGVLAATKLMYSNWWQKKSSVGNDTSFTMILENMTEDELLIDAGESVTKLLSSKNSQSFDLNALSKLTIKSNSTDNISKDMNIYLWLYKQYRKSATLRIIIKPETAQWKRWLFGTRYTYTASWQ